MADKAEKAPTATRYHARALGVGYVNETLHVEGDELMYVVHPGVTPPKWVELLDKGTPVELAKLPKPADIMAAEPVKSVKAGFAASLAATGGGEVI